MAEKKSAPQSKAKKIIDVAHPDDVKPEIGSKPMIVGHKSTAKDTTVTESKDGSSAIIIEDNVIDDNSATIDEPSEPKKEIRKTKKKLAPLSDSDKEDAAPQTSEEDSVQEATESDTSEQKSNETQAAEESAKDVEKESDEKESDIDPIAKQLELDENLKKLIESKKYRVNIKESSSASLGKILGIILALVVAAAAGLFLLIDSGTIESDIDLPFSIFGEQTAVVKPAIPEPKNEVEAPKEQETASVQEKETPETLETVSHAPTPEGYTLFDGSSFGFSFSYPEEFGDVQVESELDGQSFFLFSDMGEYRFRVNEVGRLGPSGHDDPTLNLQSFTVGSLKTDLIYLDPEAQTTTASEANVLLSDAEDGARYIIFQGQGEAYYIGAIATIGESTMYESVVFNYSNLQAPVQEAPYTDTDPPAQQLKAMLDTFRTN